jgi:hypothetical protein
MYSVKILALLTGLLFLNACCTKIPSKTVVSNEVEAKINKDEKSMLEAGFQKASILHFENQVPPCEYLIELESSKLLLEPQKELAAAFKADKTLIWVTYQPQRRMSNCANAQPIGVIAIEKR